MKLYRTVPVLLLAATLSVLGCSSRKERVQHQPEVISLPLKAVAAAKLPNTFTVTGTVQASETAQLSAQMMGNITSILVREGDAVKRGQVLATIDSAQAMAGLQRAQAAERAAQQEAAAAESERVLADSTLHRYETLYQRKSISPQEFDEIKARSQSASARSNAAQANLAQSKAVVEQASTAFNYSKVRAPFDGLVTERRVDPGVLASPGMPILTMESAGRYRFLMSVDEKYISSLKLGESVPVSLDAIGATPMNGKVTQIVSSADPGTRTFLVKIDLPSSPVLRSGLYGHATFTHGERDIIAIDKSSVVSRGALKGVYVLANDKVASLRYVTTGEDVGNQVEILSGLSANEVIVLAPADREIAGKRVEVQ